MLNPLIRTLVKVLVASLIVGTIPVFAGLALVMPILGHSSFHLYRKLIAPPKV